MSAGTALAAEIAAALAEAWVATGDGPLVATIVRRVRSGGPDPAPTYAETRTEARVVLDGWTAMERQGTSIAATDLKVMVPALDFEISGSDTLEIDGVAYEIVDPMPLRPGGVTVMTTFAARR